LIMEHDAVMAFCVAAQAYQARSSSHSIFYVSHPSAMTQKIAQEP
jgi:hypothetical protein